MSQWQVPASRFRSSRAILALGVLWLSAGLVLGQTPAPDWIRVADRVAWSPRDSCGEAVHRGRMWLLGGWLNSYQVGPRDVWSSADGMTWDRVREAAAWEHGDLPTTLVFRDKIWIMGGWYGGRLPQASASNQVWSSPDGIEWTPATRSAPWSPRLGAAGVVFRDRMWILGGVERYYDGGPEHLRNDVWSSADGVNWERVVEKAPWPARAYHAALAYDGRIWLLGGGNYQPGYLAFNDVWSSADGVQWTQEAEQAPWSPRIWFSAEVYRGRMWLLGGWSNHPSRNWNDVWHSTNGRDWTRFETRTIWSPRHEQSSYVHQDKLWIAGGNAWPLLNDVWCLDVPASWFQDR